MHAAHEPIVLALVRLQYVEADDDTVEQLRDAAADGHTRRLLQLLRQAINPDQTVATVDPDVTALMLASYEGHLGAVAPLCDAGNDKDKANVLGATALHAASQEEHLEVARLLCNAGADKDKGTVNGVTALYAASQEGHPEVVRLLCNAGADKDKANELGATALHATSQQAQQGHLEALHLLCLPPTYPSFVRAGG